MIISARFATGTAVHAAEFGKIACGAGVSRAAGTGITKVHKAVKVDAEVTCKRCLKALARGWKAIEAPAAPAVETKTETAHAATCWKCDERIVGTVAEIKDHMRTCTAEIEF